MYCDKNTVLLSAAKGLKITTTGLLITESGRQITYQEAREQKLLDNINIFDFVYEQEKKSSVDLMSVESAGESKSSGDSSQMTSEDVNYLKENLGIPLTLALAEITAVQPKDPIHYLGHWLFKYRYNQEILVTHSGRRVPELTALPVSSKAMIASCQGADV
ncbi:unnamed protein product [Callosobruchus maculatus]|uniref:Uncharacterized protein n=1 Tax=Callosobruchus maculatus TaxID=64391 RepID=A0A653CU71_CALMS|nr:unnamed protein product [Callosobruchus maculatus]